MTKGYDFDARREAEERMHASIDLRERLSGDLAEVDLRDIVDGLDQGMQVDHRALLREIAYRLYLHAVCVKDIA